MRSVLARTMLLLVLATAGSAQVVTGTLTHSIDPNTVSAPGLTPHCFVGTNSADNGFLRLFSLAGTAGPVVEIYAVTFGVESLTVTQPGGFPMVINLYAAPAITPYANYVLRGTQSFSLQPGPALRTQALSVPALFSPSENLVVEIVALSGLYTGQSFVLGSNSSGQTAPSYLRAPGCGIVEPGNVAPSYPNAHFVITAHWAQSQIYYPGTGEDLVMLSGINADLPTTGSAAQIKAPLVGDNLTFEVKSPNGGFDNREVLLLAEVFPVAAPPFPPIVPNIHVTAAGLILLIGGTVEPFGTPTILSPHGARFTVSVPPGLSGFAAIFQGAVVAFTPPAAANGIYAATDAHFLVLP